VQTGICPLLNIREINWPEMVCQYLQYVSLFLSIQSASHDKFTGSRSSPTCRRCRNWTNHFREARDTSSWVRWRASTSHIAVSGQPAGYLGKAAIESNHQFLVSCSHEYTEARRKPRLRVIYFNVPLRLRMELDVPGADYALRSNLAHRTGHRDTKLIVDARLAVVFHRHAEGATGAAGAGE
jgi:hypothetical protein